MFPIDVSRYRPVPLDPGNEALTKAQFDQLSLNIDIMRDSIIFMTAMANAKGIGGHTGGAYDIVPESLIMDGFIRGGADICPTLYDAAGHRVAFQYCFTALDERIDGMNPDDLLRYREFDSGLPGHPERDPERGIGFSSGRLGHMFAYVNGVAEANPGKAVPLLSSDGTLQEGTDAEAARYAVANGLKIILLVDDNNVTIEGYTRDYMSGFSAADTLKGQGISVFECPGENTAELYTAVRGALQAKGPAAVICTRVMAPGVPGIENTTKGHDTVPVEFAIEYLSARGYDKAVEMLNSAEKVTFARQYAGSSPEKDKNRSQFGAVVCDILRGLSPEQRKKVLVISADLGGSTGVDKIGKEFPELYRMGGVMERNGFSAAAGFGSKEGYQGIFATFSAFSEMVISEITMARLNGSNALVHFSHAGIDEMADNVSHFGINNFFTDNGLPEDDKTRLYFPADALQLRSILETIFFDPGIRFLFSTRSAVPYILTSSGERFFDPGTGYGFNPDADEIIRGGSDGYIVSYGEMLYRSLAAVENLKKDGLDIGLINKPVLNIRDDKMLDNLLGSPFVLVVESQNEKTGLGIRFGTWLLEKGFKNRYAHIGSTRPGRGGLLEQTGFQGLEPGNIEQKLRSLI